jgi:hypothetical protein
MDDSIATGCLYLSNSGESIPLRLIETGLNIDQIQI